MIEPFWEDPHERTSPARYDESPERSPPDRARLVVLGAETVLTYSLPAKGSVTIGRALTADVSLQDYSISRLHARVSVSPPTAIDRGLRIRDLGSSNGTSLAGHKIPPEQDVPFEPGQLIDIGNTTIVVKRGLAAGPLRRLCPHGYFELRLEEECERAKHSGGEFAVLRIHVKSDSAGGVEKALTAFFSPQDLMALYAPSEYEVMLLGGTRSTAEEAVAAIRFALSRIGADCQVGSACFPHDGQEPGVLTEKASASIRGRPREPGATRAKGPIIEDPKMKQVYDLVARIAPSDIGVLILGETGVGKEVLAHAVHAQSKRAKSPFLAINCAALPEDLLESELFGHERGAFTGAMKSKPGLLETAEAGTVFLDEIGELPASTQVKLLRVLEERKARRIGGLEPKVLNVRFIAATNRDLEREIADGKFREDLYYRLSGISIVIPPLRERRGEIMTLAVSFGAEIRARDGLSGDARFLPKAIEHLCAYDWPGNVRELRNVIERAVVLSGDSPIGPEHLPLEKLSAALIVQSAPVLRPGVIEKADSLPTGENPQLARASAPKTGPVAMSGSVAPEEVHAKGMLPEEGGAEAPVDLRRTLEPGALSARDLRAPARQPTQPTSITDELADLEKSRILAALEDAGGNQTRAAERLGISRKALLKRLDRYQIARPRKGQP